MGKRFNTVDEAYAYLHKQSIREGIAKHFRPHTLGDVEDDLSGFISCTGTMELWKYQADELIEYLKSEGLVKVVEGELPINPYIAADTKEIKDFCYVYGIAQHAMLEAGYRLTKEIG